MFDSSVLQIIDADEPINLPDRWIGLSVLQKAIRRGDQVLASRAAVALLSADSAALWRRLLTIAFEDVGIGDIAALSLCARAVDNPKWRRGFGSDQQTAAGLAAMLAAAPKDRSADYLFCTAMTHPSLEAVRNQAGTATVSQRLDLLGRKETPLSSRAVMAWYASGVENYPEQRVGKGDFAALLEVYRQLGVSEDLVEATQIAVRRTRHPFTLMVALASAQADGRDCQIVEHQLQQTEFVGEIPLHALDRFTRLGKRAIGCFCRQNDSLRSLLEELVPDRWWSALVGNAVFYAEGNKVSRQRVWSGTGELERLGAESDLLPDQIAPDAIPVLIRTVEENIGHLNALRADLVISPR